MWSLSQFVRHLLEAGDNSQQFDTGAANLICAAGVPGSEDIPIASHLKQLDDYAQLVARGTANMVPNFQSRPAEYNNSAAFFHMIVMATILQRNFGISYHPVSSRAGRSR